MVLAYWRERQGIIRRVVSKFCLDVSSLKSEGLMGIPTRVNTEDETHPGLQQARGGINRVVVPLVSLDLHGG